MANDIEKAEVIEAEVLDEHGRPVGQDGPRALPAHGFGKIILGIMAIAGSFLLSLAFMMLMLLLFLPLLILRALGLIKGDFKIMRFK